MLIMNKTAPVLLHTFETKKQLRLDAIEHHPPPQKQHHNNNEHANCIVNIHSKCVAIDMLMHMHAARMLILLREPILLTMTTGAHSTP